MAKTTYQGVNLTKLKELQLGGSGGASNWFKLEGYNQAYDIRLLPPMHGQDIPWVQHQLHYNQVGGKSGSFQHEGKGRAITCLGDGCPVCAVSEWLKVNGEEDRAKQLRAKTQYYMNIIDRKDNSVKLWGAPVTVVKKLQALMSIPKIGDLTHPVKGRDLTIVRSGNAREYWNVEYQVVQDDMPSVIGVDNWDEKGKNLSDLITVFPLETVHQILVANLTDLPLNDILGIEVAPPPPKASPRKGKK